MSCDCGNTTHTITINFFSIYFSSMVRSFGIYSDGFGLDV